MKSSQTHCVAARATLVTPRVIPLTSCSSQRRFQCRLYSSFSFTLTGARNPGHGWLELMWMFFGNRTRSLRRTHVYTYIAENNKILILEQRESVGTTRQTGDSHWAITHRIVGFARSISHKRWGFCKRAATTFLLFKLSVLLFNVEAHAQLDCMKTNRQKQAVGTSKLGKEFPV